VFVKSCGGRATGSLGGISFEILRLYADGCPHFGPANVDKSSVSE